MNRYFLYLVPIAICLGFAIAISFMFADEDDFRVAGAVQDDASGPCAFVVDRDGEKYFMISGKRHPWRKGQLVFMRSKLPITSSTNLLNIEESDYPVIYLISDPELTIDVVWRVSDGAQIVPKN